jgi:hypothetical protein
MIKPEFEFVYAADGQLGRGHSRWRRPPNMKEY